MKHQLVAGIIAVSITGRRRVIMIKHRIHTGVLVAVLGAVGGLLTVTPAHAQTPYEGQVIAKSGLSVRHLPTNISTRKGTLKPGQIIEIVCQVRGTRVDGNNRWYALPPTLNEWVSARYVRNLGSEPRWCGSDERYAGRTIAALKMREAPTTSTASVGTLNRGTGVDLICKLTAQRIDGNKLWYYMTNGRWVAARYIENVGRAPRWCN